MACARGLRVLPCRWPFIEERANTFLAFRRGAHPGNVLGGFLDHRIIDRPAGDELRQASSLAAAYMFTALR